MVTTNFGRVIEAFACIGTLLAAIGLIGSPALAQKSAQPVSVKIGYFNQAVVKASYPEGAETEQLRLQAESQMRREVDEANKKLEKARADKKPAEEVQKLSEKIQSDLSAKQQALAELVQSSAASAVAKVFQAAGAVAKDKGLDIVVDGAGVFAGGQKLLDNGVDVTQDIVKKLAPNLDTGAKK